MGSPASIRFPRSLTANHPWDLKPASLARSLEWLPTVENRGEGIFIQFKADVIKAWLEKSAVKDREQVLSQGFKVWKDERPTLDRQFEGAAYYMLHSLAHMLITSLALDCGYPMSSLRERIYGGVGMEGSYGILIYTGSSDAEGTLGGLIEAGRKIDRHFLRALQGGKLCARITIQGPKGRRTCSAVPVTAVSLLPRLHASSSITCSTVPSLYRP